MIPIITGSECLIPSSIGEKVAKVIAPGGIPILQDSPNVRIQTYNNTYYEQVTARTVQRKIAYPKPDEDEDDDTEIANDVKTGEVGKIDFWPLVAKLQWVDKESNHGPIRNPFRASQKWTFDEHKGVQREIRPIFDRMKAQFDQARFAQHNLIDPDNMARMIYHVIARGQAVYESVLEDTDFGVGFIGQECGFMELVTQKFT